MAILTGVRWYHVVLIVLICISLIMSNIEHLFMWVLLCLLWRNVYLDLCPSFWLGRLFFWYWVGRWILNHWTTREVLGEVLETKMRLWGMHSEFLSGPHYTSRIGGISNPIFQAQVTIMMAEWVNRASQVAQWWRIHLSVLEMGRSPAEGNGNPVQYSYLENSMDRGAGWAPWPGRGVTKSWTQLSH